MARPKKLTFPIGHVEMLRLILPKKRPEDRMKIFREWSRANLVSKTGRLPTDKEAQAEFEGWCKHQWKDIYAVHDMADFLKAFVPHFLALNRKERAKTAAKESWSKENREKRKEGRKKRAERKVMEEKMQQRQKIFLRPG